MSLPFPEPQLNTAHVHNWFQLEMCAEVFFESHSYYFGLYLPAIYFRKI